MYLCVRSIIIHPTGSVNLFFSFKYGTTLGMRSALLLTVLLLLTITGITRNTIWMDDGGLWNDVIRKSPQKARGLNELALHAIQSHDYRAAIDAFMKCLQLNPYMPQAYINIGIAYEGLNRIDLAEQAYRKAISMSPDDPTAFYNLGVLYYKTGRERQKALDLFLKARDLDPLEPDVHQYLGYIYRDKGDIVRSQEEFRQYDMLK